MGLREVDEDTLEKIAHALGYSGSDLQLKIYELDMSGALDELKTLNEKTGLENCKGGYNDLPVSRFMVKNADSQEITVPVYGMPQKDETILLDKTHPIGSVICPSTLMKETDLYGIRLTTQTLGSIIPQRSILVVAPNAKIQDGDIIVLPLENNKVLLASAGVEENGTWFYKTFSPAVKKELSFDEQKKLQRIVYIAIP